MPFHTQNSWMVFRQCGFSHVFASHLTAWITCHTLSSRMVFSAVWVLSCLCKSPDCLNFLSHFEQQNGFSWVWILSWFLRFPDVAKLFRHFEQQNGFSSVWILSRVRKLPACVSVVTLWAAEWFLMSVDSFMIPKIPWCGKILLTLWAAEWLLISVNSFMCPQITSLCECCHTLSSRMASP